jgi:hypothetical protein
MLEPLTREELVTVRDWAEDRVERAYAARREDEDTAIRVPEDDELDDEAAEMARQWAEDERREDERRKLEKQQYEEEDGYAPWILE